MCLNSPILREWATPSLTVWFILLGFHEIRKDLATQYILKEQTYQFYELFVIIYRAYIYSHIGAYKVSVCQNVRHWMTYKWRSSFFVT